MREPGQRRITPSSTLTRSFTEPGTPHAMRRIKFFTPRDTGGLNVLDKRLLLVVPLAFDGSMADGPHSVYPLQANLLLPD